MTSTSLNHASVLASIMESHFQELDLIPEQLLLNKEEMLPILQKCFSAHRIKPGPVDSAFIKDCVFIKIVHCYLLEAGKEKQAEEYLQKVSPASRVEHLESIKMWNFLTPPSHVFKVMEDMGLGTNPSSFFMPPAPHEVFPTPAPGWRPGQATADG